MSASSDAPASRRRASAAPPRLRRRHISPRQAAWLLIRTPDDRDPQDEAFVRVLCEAEPEVALTYRLAQAFKQVVQQRQAEALPTWLLQVEASEMREVQDFVAGIGRDYGAVRQALRQDYSNGPVQGHVNRLKMIKRSM